MPNLGLRSSLKSTGLVAPGIIRDSLVLKHDYIADSVVPVSDGACKFNGTSDYIAIGAKPVDTADATYCFWANSTVTGVNSAVFSHVGDSVGAFHFNASANRPLLYLEGSLYKYWVDTSAQDDGNWHHWAVVVDISSMADSKLYVDGVEIAQDSVVTTGTINSYGNLEIGRGTSSTEWEGYLCNFGVWSGLLSQAEIKSIMWKNYSDLSTVEKEYKGGLVSWWNLDEGLDAEDGDLGTKKYHAVDNHDSTVGPELNTHDNATNPSSDTNSLTGWVNTDMNTFEASNTYSTVGSYSLHVTSVDADDHCASTAFTTEAGALYRISWDFKITNHDGTSKMAFRLGTSGTYGLAANYDLADYRSNQIAPSDTDWVSVVKYFIADSTTTYISLKEIGSGNDPDCYLDNLSLKKVSGGNPGTLL